MSTRSLTMTLHLRQRQTARQSRSTPWLRLKLLQTTGDASTIMCLHQCFLLVGGTLLHMQLILLICRAGWSQRAQC